MKNQTFFAGDVTVQYIQTWVVTVLRRKAYMILCVEFHYSRSRARARAWDIA